MIATDSDENDSVENSTDVVFVRRRDAKAVKVALEHANLLDREYRIAPVAAVDALVTDDPPKVESPLPAGDCVAIPVTSAFDEDASSFPAGRSRHANDENVRWRNLIAGRGRQVCPPSSASLGRKRQGGGKRRPRNRLAECGDEADGSQQGRGDVESLSTVQLALVETLMQSVSKESAYSGSGKAATRRGIIADVRALPLSACPKKIERIGEDHTLVIPRKALTFDDPAFLGLFLKVLTGKEGTNRAQSAALKLLWPELACRHGSSRVVRRGDIDPESKVRESGHRILWPDIDEVLEKGVPLQTGPGSPGWIKITEHGIDQSFDLTRVMFSRGNVTEKKRFGQLVQEGEVVLDMYAGIGYYTLPALIHGKASHVYACEWNLHAAAALRHNLRENGVDDRATVIVGDSRVTAIRDDVVGRIDRVSLGLLPSSEGGWATAVRSLNKDAGGWLHVHGNVPTSERTKWAHWLCDRIASLARESGHDGWSVVCTNIEKVKSFAPRVDHVVADVLVGSPSGARFGHDLEGPSTGIMQDETWLPCPGIVATPSCALGAGILDQKWMAET